MAKNPDYTASAENLTNAKEVLCLMDERAVVLKELQSLALSLRESEFGKLMTLNEGRLEVLTGEIKAEIVRLGGYQDIELGIYALKQKKVSLRYNAEPFIQAFPDYEKAVTVTEVNVEKIKGLVKGKLITEEELQRAHVITESATYSTIIKDGRVE